ncbi:MAG: DUF3107 domain-containing protein [Propionibacteriaceae bacterium]
MEIKVGIQHINREIVFESTESAKAVEDSLMKALKDGSLFSVTDERGRKLFIPAASIGYVDLGEETTRRVGFGNT